jgi:hypothetical protein
MCIPYQPPISYANICACTISALALHFRHHYMHIEAYWVLRSLISSIAQRIMLITLPFNLLLSRATPLYFQMVPVQGFWDGGIA